MHDSMLPLNIIGWCTKKCTIETLLLPTRYLFVNFTFYKRCCSLNQIRPSQWYHAPKISIYLSIAVVRLVVVDVEVVVVQQVNFTTMSATAKHSHSHTISFNLNYLRFPTYRSTKTKFRFCWRLVARWLQLELDELTLNPGQGYIDK